MVEHKSGHRVGEGGGGEEQGEEEEDEEEEDDEDDEEEEEEEEDEEEEGEGCVIHRLFYGYFKVCFSSAV